jgi:hypothetical protein
MKVVDQGINHTVLGGSGFKGFIALLFPIPDTNDDLCTVLNLIYLFYPLNEASSFTVTQTMGNTAVPYKYFNLLV